jgi:hypothetical protein
MRQVNYARGSVRVGPFPKGGCQMRPPTERDQCQAKIDILIEGFMRADWTAFTVARRDVM